MSNRKGGVSPGGAGAGVRAQLLKAKAQNRELREAVQDLQTRVCPCHSSPFTHSSQLTAHSSPLTLLLQYLDADNQLKFAMSQRAGLDFQMRQMAQERDGLRESCNERDLALSKLREELAARDEASQSTSDEEVNKVRTCSPRKPRLVGCNASLSDVTQPTHVHIPSCERRWRQRRQMPIECASPMRLFRSSCTHYRLMHKQCFHLASASTR